MSPATPPETTPRRGKRVQTACERCRRQKLKCGAERPCPLCLHADVPCVPRSRSSHLKRQRRQRRDRHGERRASFDDGRYAGNSARHGRCDVVEEDGSGSPGGASPDANSDPSTSYEGRHDAELAHRQAAHVSGAFKQRTSSFGIFKEIIDQFSPDMVVNTSTSALPGGCQSRRESPTHNQQMSGLAEMLGIELPSEVDMSFLLESYLSSVHWFMMVFHEPSFRRRYGKILVSRHLDRSDHAFAIFVLLLLGMGARYADPRETRQRCPSLDLRGFQERAIQKVESCLLELFDKATLESVQICVLLGSFYLYNGRPNLGFVTLGCGIRCAQSMSLHRETSSVGAIAREERRRVWWALYIFDRFASIVYGRPCGIRDGEFSVGIPENIDDTNTEHPAFHTDAPTPNGTLERVTLFSYFKFKIRLYRIASPIFGDIYFHRASSLAMLREKVQKIDNELSAWFRDLPPELRLDRLITAPSSPGWKSTADTFAMQALALQVAYDNILILLHRPLLPLPLSMPIPLAGDVVRGSSSQDRCWESSMRTSNLSRYKGCVELARQTHAAAFVGINLFTAGMVLSIVALSKPLSEQAQAAKHAIGRVLSLSQALQNRALLASQTSKVLADLVRLILDKEMKAIVGQSDASTAATTGHDQPHPSHGMEQLDGQRGDADSLPTWNGGPGVSSQPAVNGSVQRDELPQPSSLSTFDLQHGLQSLQQAIYPYPEPQTGSASSFVGAQQAESSFGFEAPDLMRLATSVDNLDAFGQSWLWEPEQWQDFG